MNKKQKIFQIFLGLIVLLFILWVIKYAIVSNKPALISSIDNKNKESETIRFVILSENKKDIIENGKVVLSIDDENIFDFFKNIDLCDQNNIESRVQFCTNKEEFKKQTFFKEIFFTKDNDAIGFTVESDTLLPDSAVGIYVNGSTKMLTNYYLGNEFLGFSVEGKYFAVQNKCFEAKCGIDIYDVDTLNIVQKINDTTSLDARDKDVIFISWEEGNILRYKLGEEDLSISL